MFTFLSFIRFERFEDFFFLQVLFIPFFLLFSWDRPQCVHRCFWWCPTGPLGSVLSSLTFVFSSVLLSQYSVILPLSAFILPLCSDVFIFFYWVFIHHWLFAASIMIFSLVYFHFQESSWASQLPTTLETPEKSI